MRWAFQHSLTHCSSVQNLCIALLRPYQYYALFISHSATLMLEFFSNIYFVIMHRQCFKPDVKHKLFLYSATQHKNNSHPSTSNHRKVKKQEMSPLLSVKPGLNMHSIKTAWLGKKKKKKKGKEFCSKNYSRKERLQRQNRSTEKQVFITSWKCLYCEYFSVSVISSTGKLRQIFATGKHSYDKN